MRKKSGTPSKIVTHPLSFEEFSEKHAKEIERLFKYPDHPKWGLTLANMLNATPTPKGAVTGGSQFHMAIKRLEQSGVGDLIRAAAVENSPEAYKAILEVICIFLRAKPPEGVFVPDRRPPGRKRAAHTQAICFWWNEMGRPKPIQEVCDEIAKRVYPEDNPRERSAKIHSIRATIHQYKSKLDS